MLITKESVLESIRISKSIIENGIENATISRTENRSNLDIYNGEIKPQIDQYTSKFGKTPNLILQLLLKDYIYTNDLNTEFESQGLHFYGQKVNSYVWASITEIDETIEGNKFSHYPQLYVLINSFGIKFGFCYGAYIRSNDEKVQVVKSDSLIQNQIIAALNTDEGLVLYSNMEARELPNSKDRITNIPEYIALNWSRDASIIKYFTAANIPDDVETQITKTFDNLLEPFKAISNPIVDQGKIIDPVNTGASTKNILNRDFQGSTFDIKSLYFEDKAKSDMVRRIQTALRNGKHIILIGPPGTGKSKLAKEICSHYCSPGNYVMHTATSEWSTFETIGGYRPLQSGELQFFPGIFLQCFKDAEGKPINKWLIIDELNRADIDKAFGSLFSALTGDNVTLPFKINGRQIEIIGDLKDDTEIQDNRFIVHPHWRIIATMNTYDKSSLYEMSYAFMRRLAFIPVEVPTEINKGLIEKYAEVWRLDIIADICTNLAELWSVINKCRKIGPSIVEDIYRYVRDTEPSDYGSAVIMYVLPQFEGLIEQQAVNFIKETVGLSFIANEDELRRFAAEFFGIDEAKFQS